MSTVHRSSSNAGFGKKIVRTKNSNEDVLQSKLKRGVSAYSGALNKDDVRHFFILYILNFIYLILYGFWSDILLLCLYHIMHCMHVIKFVRM